MIPPEELTVEALRDAPGGQHVGIRTGVKITHIPTGIVAIVETERSQYRNRAIALDMIEAALTSPNFRNYVAVTPYFLAGLPNRPLCS